MGEEIKTLLVCVKLLSDERDLQDALKSVAEALEALCTSRSTPIFNHPDGKEFAVIVQSHLPAFEISNGMYHGHVRTNNVASLGSRDEILVLPIDRNEQWGSIGYSGIWKNLPDHRLNR